MENRSRGHVTKSNGKLIRRLFCYLLNSYQCFRVWFFKSYRANEVCHTSSPKHELKTVSEEVVQLFWSFSRAHSRPTKCFCSVSYRIQVLRYRWTRWLDPIPERKKEVSLKEERFEVLWRCDRPKSSSDRTRGRINRWCLRKYTYRTDFNEYDSESPWSSVWRTTRNYYLLSFL